MSNLTQLQTIINALGWTLIHFLWQGLVIAAVYWAVSRLTRPESVLARYWFGMLAFVCALLIPGATFILYWESSLEPLTGAVASATSVATVTAGVRPAFTQILSAMMQPVIPLVVLLWSSGVAVLSVRAWFGWLGARRLVEWETAEVSEGLQLIARRLKAQLGIQTAVRVLQSSRVVVPTVVGWLKPAILLPISVLARLPEDQLEMIIAHELGHIRRHDYLFNLLQVVIETLFFYHPAIRWLSRQVRQEREHCCDDVVLSHCESPVLYARALANLEILRAPLPGMALSASGGDLVYRVTRIVRGDLPGNNSGFAHLMVMLGITALVSVSAQQGMEIRRHLVEKSLLSQQAIPLSSRSQGITRSGWVAGLSDYSDTRTGAAETVLPVIEHRVSEAGPDSNPPGSETGAAELKLAFQPPADLPADILLTGLAPLADVVPGHPGDGFEMAVDLQTDQSLAYVQPPEQEKPLPQEVETISGDSMSEVFSLTPQFTVAPVYPFKARRQRLEGQVRLEFSINPSGKPSDIRVVESTPSDIFEESAVKALKKWVFNPDDVQPENGRLFQVFDFAMEDKGPIIPRRERRCDITGSRICGTQAYNSKDPDPSG